MPRLFLAALTAAVLAHPSAASADGFFDLFSRGHAEEPEFFRHKNVDQAWAATQASGRPMFIYVSSDNCRFCEKMLKETLSSPPIGKGLTDFTEPATFNASEHPELAQSLGVRAYPTTLIISADRKLLHKIEGFVETAEFTEQVWPVLRESAAARRMAMNPAATQ